MKDRINYGILLPVGCLRFFTILFDSGAKMIFAFYLSSIVMLSAQGEFQLKSGLVLLGFVIAAFFALMLLRIFTETQSKKAEQGFFEDVYRKALEQDVKKLEALGIGGVKERATGDLKAFFAAMTYGYPLFFASLISALGFLGYIFVENKYIALIFFVISASKLIPQIIVKKAFGNIYDRTAKVNERWMSHINESAGGLLTIKAFSLNNTYISKLKEINRDFGRAFFEKFRMFFRRDVVNNGADIFVTYGSYICIGLFYFYNGIEIQGAVRLVAISASFFGAVSNMFLNFSTFFTVPKAKGRLVQLFHPNIEQNNVETDDFHNVFTVENLSFSYGENPVFKDFSLNIKRGEKLFVKGENGCGKSTLARILLGIEGEYSGKVLFEGKDTRGIGENSIFKRVDFLPQLDCSVEVSPDLLMSFAQNTHKIFGISDENLKVKSLAKLSGGEVKKLLFNLCISKDKDVVILDEPSNNLDSQSIVILQEFLQNTDKTVILISHNQAFEKLCTRVIRLNNEAA